MSLSKPFLKETKNHLLILPEVWGPVQIVAQCSDWIEGPVTLEGSIQSWSQGRYNPWGHTVWTLFGQLILGKLGDGYRDTFDQSDWCLIFLFCQECISLLCLPDPRAKRKTVLKVKCFKEASLIGSKWTLSAGAKTRKRFQEGSPLRPLGLSQWKLSRRRVRFSSLLTLMGKFPRLSATADL